MLTPRITILAGLLALLVVGEQLSAERTASVQDAGFTLEDTRVLVRHGEFSSAYYHGFSTKPDKNIDSDELRERTDLEVQLLTILGRYDAADSLLALHVPLGDSDAIFRHVLRRGMLAVMAGNFGRARDLLTGIASDGPAGRAGTIPS